MKKQKKQFLFIIVILILFVAGYLIAGNLPDEEETVIGTESHNVTSIVQENVTEISYMYEDDIVELIKEEDVWKSKEDKSLSLDQSVISTMLSYICSITTDTVIENPNDVRDYGLINPANTITLTLEDNSSVQLLIGDYLELTGQYYAQLSGDPNVYMISSYIPSYFNKSVDMLIITEETSVE